MKYFIPAIISLVVLSGCAAKFNGSSPLFRSQWVLTELNGVPVQLSNSEEDAYIRFTYDGSTAEGRGGCNRFNSSVTADSKKLSLGPIASTKMYCADQKFEDRFLEELAKVRRYSMNDGMLMLQNDKRQTILMFKAR